MKIIVGLGNPGEKYLNTRHNYGFMFVDFLAGQNADWQKHKKANCLFYTGQGAIFIKPQTFMNNSGLAVRVIADYYKIKPEHIIVAHDDIDLALGEFKIQQDKSSAGHKGVQSIIDTLGTNDFMRIRLGISLRASLGAKLLIPRSLAPDTEKFVLQKFTDEEMGIVNQTMKKAAAELTTADLVANPQG